MEALTAKQERLLLSLLSEPTIAGAAVVAGVGEVTAHRWLRQPDFADAYHAARREAFGQALGRLQQLAGAAVERLANLMDDPEARPATQLAAAKAILDAALRAHEQGELEHRLRALELQAEQAYAERRAG